MKRNRPYSNSEILVSQESRGGEILEFPLGILSEDKNRRAKKKLGRTTASRKGQTVKTGKKLQRPRRKDGRIKKRLRARGHEKKKKKQRKRGYLR